MQTAKEEFAILFKAAISKVVCKVSTLEDELEELKVFRFKFNPDKTAWLLKGVACVLLEFVLSVKREQKPVPQMITYKEVAEQANRLFSEWGVSEEIKFPLRGNALANQLGWILGLLSSFSWFSGGIWLSSIVQTQRGNKPSSGFHDLVFQLTGKYPQDSDVFEFQRQVFEKL
jgi:hypothetical protein